MVLDEVIKHKAEFERSPNIANVNKSYKNRTRKNGIPICMTIAVEQTSSVQ